ncbi:uncharacterized protein SPAPADRAFT_61652, partial [Spathaspora passalidarum NRRL Y-27907]
MLRAVTLKRTIIQTLSKRQFTGTSLLRDASVFKMPAMSPTMTEGGIVSWKFKPGDSFNSGDVLLEVETDKANIDVEAVDDGKLWEILVPEGAKGIPVGQAIAFIAEPEDDLSSLTKPTIEEPAAAETPAKEEPAIETTKSSSAPAAPSATEAKADSTGVLKSANPNQKISPAVELLLHEHGISNEEALAKIPASGPKGRLLKGDVLAHIGSIDINSVVKLTEFLNNKQHLDLSNIVPAPPKEEASAKSAETATPAAPPKPKNILTIELTSELGEDVSQAKFRFAFEKSLSNAIKQTYAARFPEYAESPTPSSLVSISSDDIFEDLVSAPVTKNRFEVYDINYKFLSKPTSTPSFSAPADDFDELLGLGTKETESHSYDTSKVNVEFKIKFDEQVTDSKQFVEYFQDSLLSQIPANQLTIS